MFSLFQEAFQTAPPKVQAGFVGVLVLLVFLQRFLGPDADWVESRRERLLIKFDEVLGLVGGFGTREIMEKEYAGTIDVPEDHGKGSREDWVERQVYQNGFYRNLIAGKKFRFVEGHKQYSDGSWAKRDGILADRQLHLHFFKASSGNFDVYVHEEPSVIRPLAHLYGGKQTYDDAAERIRGDFEGTELELIIP